MRRIFLIVYLSLLFVLFWIIADKNELSYPFELIDKNEYKLYVVIYFSPDCDLCHSLLLKLEDCSDDICFNLISLNTLDEINNFMCKIDVCGKKNITFVCDNELKYYDELKILSIPSVFIYNSKKILVFKVNGYTDIVDVTNYLLEK